MLLYSERLEKVKQGEADRRKTRYLARLSVIGHRSTVHALSPCIFPGISDQQLTAGSGAVPPSDPQDPMCTPVPVWAVALSRLSRFPETQLQVLATRRPLSMDPELHMHTRPVVPFQTSWKAIEVWLRACFYI